MKLQNITVTSNYVNYQLTQKYGLAIIDYILLLSIIHNYNKYKNLSEINLMK